MSCDAVFRLHRHARPGHTALVAGAPQREMDEQVAAFIVTNDGNPLPEATVTAHCRAHLAPYKVPGIIRFVPEIPRNAGGKPLKAALLATLGPAPCPPCP